jgi:hypothetical protein
MAIRVSCPSCNTQVTLPTVPTDRRVDCPRCGDVFPLRHWEETTDDGVPRPARASPSQERPSRGRNRLALVGLGLAFLLLGVFLGWRADRSRSRPRPLTPVETSDRVRPATQLLGVGYLPADTNIAFALQMAPIRDYAQRTQQDPPALLAAAGIPARFLDTLNQVGLNLDQIDHVVGGTSLGDGAFAVRFTLVVVLRGVLPDDAEFLEKLKARRQPGIKPRYDVEVAGVPLSLARVSETVWVFGFDAQHDLAAVDRDYGPGGRQLPPSLTALLAEQVPPTAAAWVATADERWADKPGAKVLAELLGRPEWLALVQKGRGGLLAVQLDEAPRLRLVLKTAEEATAQQVRKYFARRQEAVAAIGGSGDLVTVELPVAPNQVWATLEQVLLDAVKKP